MSNINIRQGDTLPVITATLSDSSGAINLTGYTVTFKAKLVGGSTVISRACTIVSAAAGTVQCTLAAPDTDVAGSYLAKFECVSGAVVLSVPNSKSMTMTIYAEDAE